MVCHRDFHSFLHDALPISGLAVAREFQRRDAMTEILFVGTEQGIEARVLPQEGFKPETLSVKGLRGRGLRGFLDALYGQSFEDRKSTRLNSSHRTISYAVF